MVNMKLAAAIKWLDTLVDGATAFQIIQNPPGVFAPKFYSEQGDPLAWLAQAGSAIGSILPPGHYIRETWGKSVRSNDRVENIKVAISLIGALQQMAQSGWLSSLVDGTRAETVGEVLEQASILLDADHVVAATVLAGGALETHLRHLCDGGGVISSLVGHGGISKYIGLMAQARKNGNEIISKADESQAEAWGKLRNEAAHDPTKFGRDASEVQLVVEGIRKFIARNGAEDVNESETGFV